MSSRAVTRLAWSLCAISVVLMALALVLRYLVRSEPLPAGFGGWPEAALGIVADLAIPVLGAIIASRRPGNPIGWLFCAAGVAVAVDSAAEGYAIYALLAGSDSSAGGVAAAWVTNWSSFFAFGLLPFVLLLFPTGKLPSRRWRPLAFLAAFLYVALPAGYALLPGPLGRFPFLENPLGYGGDAGEILPGVNQALAWMAFLMVTLAATISLVLRFRRSRGVERQQIKWFAYAAMLVAAYLIADLFFQDALTPVAPFLDPIIFGSLFAAIAIAILRHRLFDIDVVINRTLVYGMLTASLALVYFSIVVLLQALLRAATSSESQLAVVASTLTIAALFQPLRRRIQGFIDHRFYRKKYDAAKTLDPFYPPLKVPTPRNRRFLAARATLDEIVYGIIAGRRRRPGEHEDLLAMLMEARDETTGEGMSDKQLRDEVITLFIAGHETTANALTWASYLLSTHVEVARRLRAEVDEKLRGRVPTAADVPELAYTRMVIDETMRLYPPVWVTNRRAIEDDTVGGYRIPAGATVTILPYVTHHDPAFWENPEGFDPERFAPERSAGRPQYAYFPFGYGPRQCIGKGFALLEMTLVLALLAQRYDLRLVPGRKVEFVAMDTLRPRYGLWMTAHPREE